ncbi:hypothetical protein SGR_3855 [Streptomyces griseus subsp. griseus NBRC 13350]|uniref:Uncharacterized protein n=1 Tax=Streptomyces griseus subsp. griseus (strain JCM 4626 / CBS 651.72 / NBRC 13350 / KCC S-0626 / ISP 5235) TaxID=455632 RepID=B1VR33_STRGG|nr:hypothetical protein SGR_3855 [Streptomyces griseus subsp. griseus NBRC 13350]
MTWTQAFHVRRLELNGRNGRCARLRHQTVVASTTGCRAPSSLADSLGGGRPQAPDQDFGRSVRGVELPLL